MRDAFFFSWTTRDLQVHRLYQPCTDARGTTLIELEGLAAMLGCLHFDLHLSAGIDFTVANAHRPLVPLFHPASRPHQGTSEWHYDSSISTCACLSTLNATSSWHSEQPSSGDLEMLGALYPSAIARGAAPNGGSTVTMSLRPEQWCEELETPHLTWTLRNRRTSFPRNVNRGAIIFVASRQVELHSLRCNKKRAATLLVDFTNRTVSNLIVIEYH